MAVIVWSLEKKIQSAKILRKWNWDVLRLLHRVSLEYTTPSAVVKLAESFVAKFSMMLSSTKRTSQVRQHSALILEPETSSRGVQRSAFNVRIVLPYLEYYHRIPIHYGNGVNLGHPYLESMITKRSNRKKLSSEISREFPNKTCWNINYLWM